jgi:hypothetical protein
MHHGERQTRWPESLLRQMQHDDGILAARKKQARPFKLCRYFSKDMD